MGFLENLKGTAFFSFTYLSELKYGEKDLEPMASKYLKVGHYRPARETPFQWRFAGGPMVSIYLPIRLNPRGGRQTGIPEYQVLRGLVEIK